MNTKYFEIFSGHICSTHSEYQMFVFPVRNWKYLIPAAANCCYGLGLTSHIYSQFEETAAR